MFESLESGIGLDTVIWFQENSNELLNLLAELGHVLGSGLFYIVFIPIFYWSIDKTFGRRLLFALLLTGLMVILFKNGLQTPRPHIAYPDQVDIFFEQEDYGFEQEDYGIPSGHTALTLVIFGLIGLWVNKVWAWLLIVPYIIFIGISRMIVGVHYPQDVIAGALLGGLILWTFARAEDRVLIGWERLSLGGQILFILLIGIGFAYLFPEDPDVFAVSSVFVGGTLGVMLDHSRLRFQNPISKEDQVKFYGIGIASTLAIFFTLRFVFNGLEPEGVFEFIRYGITGFYITAVYPFIVDRMDIAGIELPTLAN